MPRIPRKLLIDPTEVGVFHCLSRCVRRAFLCGSDPLSGKNFDHRKRWLQERIAFLAGQFGIDVLGFAVMSNHLHVILRNRPDVVAGWSDDEVARRWWNVFPLRRDETGRPAEPEAWELSLVAGSPDRLAEVRQRLSSLSWFMRCIAEPIARQANREDRCTGRFWEGRYKCVPLLDESALTACLAYVDLNPIRAGIAQSPETSRFTSVFERIAALREGDGSEERAAGDEDTAGDEPGNDNADMHAEALVGTTRSESLDPEIPATTIDAGYEPVAPEVPPAAEAAGVRSRDYNRVRRAGWLSPFTLSESLGDEPVPSGRASNTGCLPMLFADYLDLLDWTGRQLRQDKRGAIPPELAPILQRLQVSDEGWFDLMQGFSRIFRHAVGRPESLRRHARKWDRPRPLGMIRSQALFG